MATATIITDLNEITDCDSTTAGGAWSGITASVGSSDPAPLEGEGRIGGIIKSASDSNSMTFTPTSPIDMSGGHLRVPMMTILKPNLKTKALGGIQLIVYDGTNTATFDVSGGDTYTGGWEVLVCDPYGVPNSGTQISGTVNSITMNFKINVAAKNIITTWFDWISYGTGIKAYGGTNGDEITFSHIDTQDVYYLINEKIKGVYRLSGKLQLGDDDGTNDCYFKDSGQIIIFEDLEVNSSLYELKVIGNSTGTTIIDLSGNFITSVADNYVITMTDATNVTSVTLDGKIIQKAGDFFGSSVVSGDGTVFDQCGMLEPNASTLTNFTVKNGTESADLKFPTTNNLSNASFISSGTGHAILLENTGEITFDNFSFTGYASSDGDTGNECIYNNSGGEVTINVTGGDTPTVMNGSGASTILVVNPVTTKVTVKDLSTGLVIENARVLVAVDNGDNYPYQDSVSITGSGTTATVSHTAHGMETGDKIIISGVTNDDVYNGVFSITYVGVDSYTYTTDTITEATASGTITATFAIIHTLSNASGIASDTRTWDYDQDVTGWVRKSTSQPYYQQGSITGTIDKSTGFSITVQMIGDE